MSNVRSILESEEAVIERWFSDSPYGLLFHGEDGRAWRIRPEAAEHWKARAQTELHRFVADSAGVELTVMLGAAGLALLAGLLLRLLGFNAGIIGASAIGVAMAAFHFLPFVRLYLFRQRQKEMRAAILASLGTATPVPADVARPYQKRNIWYVAQYGVIFLMIAAVAGIELFSRHTVFSSEDPTDKAMTGSNPLLLVAPLVVGLVLAWAFHVLAKSEDRKQQR
jgi:hypothetical protein